MDPGQSVVLLDGARKPGAKILISGGTRCNVTNVVVSERDFWGGKSTVVRRILRSFPTGETVRFFEEIGVHLHEEAKGKLFPDSGRARDVLAALLREIDRLGATLCTAQRVVDVERDGERFLVRTSSAVVCARHVVLATGGRSLPKTGSDGAGLAIAERLGHSIVETTPALAPLVLGDPDVHRELAGVSQDVELTIWIDRARACRLSGSLLWTHFGASGPVALDASRHWNRAKIEGRDVAITANFWKGLPFDKVDVELQSTARARPKLSAQVALAAELPASTARAILHTTGIDGERALSQLARDERRRLARALAEWPLPVTGTRGYNYADATAGGVALEEIDPATMESRVCPGLVLVGEMLDVDGRIGGFNFQWAWSSAYVAAKGLTRTPVCR